MRSPHGSLLRRPVAGLVTAPRQISILGATGSVGQATLDLVDRAPDGAFEVVALTARDNVDALADLARRHRARFAAVADEAAGAALADRLAGSGVRCGSGEAALEEAAAMDADWTMAAIVGAAGLKPTLTALRQGRNLAFANKECLVCAGALFMAEARRAGATLLPVDSEHNAIFQVFDPDRREGIRSITLTASGGPFRDASIETMRSARAADALAHPVWSMGAKISIDSATMMNKGLEIIEACWLFDLPHEQVRVVVHPQSIVHGLVEYADGSMLAQLGSPDMRTPIAHALAWPDRMEAPSPPLDLAALAKLEFETPDPQKFPALRLAREALEAGGAAPAVLNAANEEAVAAFLDDRIGFLDIASTVAKVLDLSVHDADMPQSVNGFEDVFAIDQRARVMTASVIQAMSAGSNS